MYTKYIHTTNVVQNLYTLCIQKVYNLHFNFAKGCHDCYFTFIHASVFFRLSFNEYLSLKEQECTKRIEKISVVTLHVFAFHNSAGDITFSVAVNVNKGLAVNAVFRSLFNILFPLIGVLFSIFAARNVCLLYKVTRRTLHTTNS